MTEPTIAEAEIADAEIAPSSGPAAPVGAWRQAVVREVSHPNPNTVRLRLDVPSRIDHLPGQHYVVRLRAEDGYTAQRSYSIASSPAEPGIELFVERLEDGEVSGFLADVVMVGDELEVRGPIGGWFVWRGVSPALLVGGGSGVVPLVSMVRHARDVGRLDLLKIAVSARSLAELPYANELISAGATVALSRVADPSIARAAGRLAAADLGPLVVGDATAFVCGSTGFAEAASRLLIGAGVPSDAIRVERFGPTG